ncbi:Cox family DNA-binding protein [Arsenophonus nasoniae]|uniref:Cox family DNA-binding protein n=1 Tax=Arsenophonus nasoniae TaxID=638 RepID=A0AA95K1G9_9GAMM|nr:Cox family DNA-binding protein [Arsenophonus nasoniae]WGL95866.1 Cox family DNA-binding protein [Arsenophonus nasoniae]
MNSEINHQKYLLKAIPLNKFAELIGKSYDATRMMAKRGKLPVFNFYSQENGSRRKYEVWVNIAEFNRMIDALYDSRPKEQRDAWTLWLK